MLLVVIIIILPLLAAEIGFPRLRIQTQRDSKTNPA